MMSNYKTKSRSQQRREAHQRGSKLPTFTGKRIQKRPEADPHIHITGAAHKALTERQKRDQKTTGKKTSLKDLASNTILAGLKK